MDSDQSPFVTLQTLQRRVEAFEASMPGLIHANPQDGQFRASLTVIADMLVEDADPSGRSWAIDRLNAILRGYGLLPLDYEVNGVVFDGETPLRDH